LLKAFTFVLWSNVRGPFVTAFFGAEKINSFVTIEELKDVVWRK